MPSRANKEERLRDNIQKGIRRAVDQWEEVHRKRCPDEVKMKFKRELMRASKLVDKQLAEVWN